MKRICWLVTGPAVMLMSLAQPRRVRGRSEPCGGAPDGPVPVTFTVPLVRNDRDRRLDEGEHLHRADLN